VWPKTVDADIDTLNFLEAQIEYLEDELQSNLANHQLKQT
jgi:hypothetical protein